MLPELLIIAGLILANGVLSAAEMAVVGVRQTRLKQLAGEGNKSALAAAALRAQPERFFATVQLGITLLGATAGAFGGSTVAGKLEPLLARVPFVGRWAEGLSLVLVVTFISYLSLVFGELVPKSLGLRSAEPYALFISRPLSWLASAARPLIWFLTASSNLVLRAVGDKTSFVESRLSSDELRQLLEEASQTGTVNRTAGHIASRALQFAQLTAQDVMVPRHRVVGIPREASREQLRALLLEHGFARMPVYDGSLDHAVGYVATRDVLNIAWEEHLFVLEDLVRPLFFVPAKKHAVELLDEMRARHQPFAAVVDESGGLEGIVTLEDLLEELVGAMSSEMTREPAVHFHQETEGVVIADGATPVRELNRALGLELPEGTASTLAGLLLAAFARIPQVGEKVRTAHGYVLEVLEASARRIRRVRISRVAH